jgi:hypothetical protein
MNRTHPKLYWAAIGCLLSVPLILMAGCDSKPQPVAVAKALVEKYSAATVLQGLVATDGGPVKIGTVKALTEKGEVLASTELAGEARYKLEIAAGIELPILLTYYPDANAGIDKRMVAAVIHTALSKYDINPSSTRIAKQAKSLGGYSHKNLVRAAEETGIVPADNKTTAGFRGDPTTQYGGWH